MVRMQCFAELSPDSRLFTHIFTAVRANQSRDERIQASGRSSRFSLQSGASFHGLAAVSAALDRLHRLATAIRRSSVENQRDKLIRKAWRSEEDAYLESCIYSFVLDRFPSARPSLLEQLTTAVCLHRKRLLYQPRHNKKLANNRGNKRKRKRDQHNLHAETVKRLQLQTNELTPTAFGHGCTAVAATVISSTDASIPHSQIRRVLVQCLKPALSVASTGSSIIQGEGLHYPDPPRFAKDENLHPCPYCSEPLPTSKLDMQKKGNVDFWR